jgi:hypothetical protein
MTFVVVPTSTHPSIYIFIHGRITLFYCWNGFIHRERIYSYCSLKEWGIIWIEGFLLKNGGYHLAGGESSRCLNI